MDTKEIVFTPEHERLSLFATQKMHEIAKTEGFLIFVFGSNEAGIHGAGAARHALEEWGAIRGKGHGPYGTSYALPTKDHQIRSLPLPAIQNYATVFKAYAKAAPELLFKVTRVGCGLAGFKDSEIAPMFRGATSNCSFDTNWHRYLGDDYEYWGHVA